MAKGFYPSYTPWGLAKHNHGKVPVLRIESPGGTKRWMPELLDTIAYLKSTLSN